MRRVPLVLAAAFIGVAVCALAGVLSVIKGHGSLVAVAAFSYLAAGVLLGRLKAD